MKTAAEVGQNARDIALRVVARELLGSSVNLHTSYDDLHKTLCDRLTFEAGMWLDETLDLAEATAVAELDPSAWSDEALPHLTAQEVDRQTEEVAMAAFEDDEAPAPGMGM